MLIREADSCRTLNTAQKLELKQARHAEVNQVSADATLAEQVVHQEGVTPGQQQLQQQQAQAQQQAPRTFAMRVTRSARFASVGGTDEETLLLPGPLPVSAGSALARVVHVPPPVLIPASDQEMPPLSNARASPIGERLSAARRRISQLFSRQYRAASAFLSTVSGRTRSATAHIGTSDEEETSASTPAAIVAATSEMRGRSRRR